MAPSKREREHARQRQAELRRRQEAKAQQARHRRNVGLTVAGAVAALALLVVVVLTATQGPDEATTASGDPSAPSATATAPPDTANPCPTPSATPVEQAPQLDGPPDPATAAGRTVTAVIATSCGDITVEMDGAAAPQAVASFEYLATEGYFDASLCHRLTTSGIFVLQCGDPTATGTGGPGYTFGPVENAPADDVYPAGTLAMARQGGDGESMGSQFFLVYEDSTIPSDAAGGYTDFGQITEGLEIVQQIADGDAPGGDGPPQRPISIEGVTIQ